MKKNTDSDWLELEYGVHLNIKWLAFGLEILCSNENYYNHATENFFKINHKTTLYKHPALRREDKIEAKGSISQLIEQTSDYHEMPENSFAFALSIFARLNEFSQRNNGSLLLMQTATDEEFYFESKEKQEIFVPFSVKNNKNQMTRFYLSLSLNNPIDNSNFKREFNGFRRFVTAGCLFGASLQAIDKKGAVFPIIQHKIAFVDGEQIIKLNPPDKAFHPYEIAQFDYLKEAISLMEKMANKEVQTEVLYHLPNFDYILSAIKLFIHNKITYEALEDFYTAIKERSKQHVSVIEGIFKESGLTLLLESPFMNLLKDFFMADDYEITYITCLEEFDGIIAEENKIYVTIKNGYFIYKILSPLAKQEEDSTDIPYTDPIFPPPDTAEIARKLLKTIARKGHARGINAFLSCLEIPIQTTKFLNHKKMEREIAQKALNLLCNNNFSSKHADVWKDIIKINFGRDKIRCIESLFKIANAVMIAVAAKDFEDYKVCSFLPFNENPIFRKYKKCKEQFSALNIPYPEVFSLTRLENLIFYSHISDGNVFYFQRSSTKLSNILKHESLIKKEGRVNFIEQPADY